MAIFVLTLAAPTKWKLHETKQVEQNLFTIKEISASSFKDKSAKMCRAMSIKQACANHLNDPQYIN